MSKILENKLLYLFGICIDGSIVLTHLPCNCIAQCIPNTVDRDSVKNLLEEAADNHACCFFASEPAASSVKDLFFVDFGSRAAMGTAYVIRFDF